MEPKPTLLIAFLSESLRIEGIEREPTEEEIKATHLFCMDGFHMSSGRICQLQEIYAPGHPLREKDGMNVRVGGYIAPPGGPDIRPALDKLCKRISRPNGNPWREHIAFERLHPFMDGNGRTGRTVWAWHMMRNGFNPFELPFLHRFYYQTLANDPLR